jgi:hypothetical protein
LPLTARGGTAVVPINKGIDPPPLPGRQAARVRAIVDRQGHVAKAMAKDNFAPF